MIKKLVLLLTLILVFSACATPTPVYTVQEAVQPTPIPLPELDIDYVHRVKIGNDTVVRFVDTEANTVCYIYQKTLEYNGIEKYGLGVAGGISCLPLNETSLEY